MSMDFQVLSSLEDWFEEFLAEGCDPEEAERLAWEQIGRDGMLCYNDEDGYESIYFRAETGLWR